MTTSTYAQRAKTLRQPPTVAPRETERGDEVRDKRDKSAPASPINDDDRSWVNEGVEPDQERSVAPWYPPLDDSIAGSEANRYSLASIETRLVRLRATAASASARPLDRQLVSDWEAIRAAKLRQMASSAPGDEGDAQVA